MGHQQSKLVYEQYTVKDDGMLTPSQIRYICQQTNLIDKEVCRRHTQFLNMTHDGRMIKEQFTTILQDIWPTGNVQRLSDYLFSLGDKYQKGFIGFTDFIILECQLDNDRSYLGFLFDMFDTRRKGSLPRETIEPLFAAMFELIGHPIDEQRGANISQRHISCLIQVVDRSKNKRLAREHFMNIRNTDWIDEENGNGILLTEHPC